MGVAVVGEHHPGLDGDEVVAAVPLLAFRVVGGATGLHHLELAQSQPGGHHLDEGLVRLDDLHTDVVVTGVQGEGLHRVDDVRIDGHHVAVGEREDGVQVHGRPNLGHARDDHLSRRLLGEQPRRHLRDGLP